MRIGNARGSVRTWLVLAAAAAGVVGVIIMVVRAPQTMMLPAYRFVDTQWRLHPATTAGGTTTPTTADVQTATLLNQTRYVLEEIPHDMVVYTPSREVPASAHLSFYPEVPATLAGAQRLALAPEIQVGSRTVYLPTSIVATELEGDRRKARVEFDVPRENVGTNVMMYVEGYEVSGSTTTYRTPEVELPKHAYLAFGIGIKRLAWPQGPVVFTIKTCVADRCEPLFAETLDARKEDGRGWQDRKVTLELLGGEKRSFLFETRLLSDAPDAFSFALWANPTVYVPHPRPRNQTNVILLSIDTLSAKHLNTYGYEHDTAPFIEETFGKHGTVFDHCVAASTTTPPSHMTMMTSVPPCVHGLTTGMEVIPEWIITLAETLRANDIATGAVTEDGWLGVEHGFGRGFNVYAENKSPDIMEPTGQVEATFARAQAWLETHREIPFFLFLHTFQVHDPYAPPPQYATLFARTDRKDATVGAPPSERDPANYDREIRYTDDQLRRLFQAIKELGLADKTVFILVSDHGEEFFEHGYWGHGAHLFDEVTQVPLMFWGPGMIPAGKRVNEMVGHIDLMPTILDLFDIASPSQVMGVSLVPIFHNKSLPPGAAERILSSEAWADFAWSPNYTTIPFNRPGYLVQSGGRKLSRYRGDKEFVYHYYDLQNDPLEQKDLYAANRAQVAAMQTRLDGYETDCKTMATKLANARQQGTSPEAGRAPVNPAAQEKLRALGYVQ